MSYIRLTGAADQHMQPPPQAPTDETVWEAGFRIANGYGNDSVANVQIFMPERGNLKARMGDVATPMRNLRQAWKMQNVYLFCGHERQRLGKQRREASGADSSHRLP